MNNRTKHPAQSYQRLTLFAIALMVLVGALIVILDWRQARQLAGNINWLLLMAALGFVAISYVCASASVVVMLRVFGVELDRNYLLRVGFISVVLENLIAHPVGLSLRLLTLGRNGVSNGKTMASSLLLSYFKNLIFFALVPLSLIYIIFSYPLFLGGLIIVSTISIILILAIIVATIIIFSKRIRTFILNLLGHLWRRLTHRSIDVSLAQFGNAMTEGIADLRHRPKIQLSLAALILADVAATIITLGLCFIALGVPIHAGALIVGFNFGITLTVISFIPGDVGVQETSMAGVFALFGVPFSHGVLVAILFRVLYYFVPFIFSLGFYWGIVRKAGKD
ncbi:MAG: flippase-like domain-containing protein [Chloroflexi bacterium]|nr:flippase-like domain-containing protein [Chloroflexota bacterium]